MGKVLFSCEGAALEVLMSVHLSVCPCVFKFEILPFSRFWKVPKIQGRFREDSGKIQGRFREDSGNVQGRFREDPGKIQARSREGFREGQRGSRVDPGKIQGRFREDQGKIKGWSERF